MKNKQKPTISSLIKEVKSGKVSPVYLLCGEESFLIEKALKSLLDILLQPETRDFNLNLLDGTIVTIQDILSAVEVYPIIADWRIVVVSESVLFQDLRKPPSTELENDLLDAVEDIDSNDPKEIFLDWITGSPPQNSTLIFTVKGPVNTREPIVKAIDRVGRFINFEKLEESSSIQRDPLFQSVSKQLAQSDKQITPSAFNLLRTQVNNDTHRFFEEINKAISFVGDRTQIDERDIRNLVSPTSSDTIFDLTDSISNRNVNQGLSSLHNILSDGEAPIKINALITRQIRLMVQAKLVLKNNAINFDARRITYQDFVSRFFQPLSKKMSGNLPKTTTVNLLKQNPYVAYKIIQKIIRFEEEELIGFLEKTLEADIQLKSNSVPPEYILEQLVYDLCRPPRRKAI
ncbi:TPA: DNA polymerase III subunit delta [Candidatus Poribacteria bacterium]|nr:DNA polymerase III subunit delta [Candidatus Poribacteria bacterium]|tara:strand:+ start:2549 stop:3757 length:1209 start_codon:yes stop_codon:yes gene_type:complete